jgi:SAM-dependent methyltransferase
MTARYQQIDWYDTPRYYDIIFDADTALECSFLDTMRHRYALTRGTRVLEPACGSGRLVAELARRGYTVSAFDRNEHMLTYTRDRIARLGLRARLRRMELEDFRYGERFDLAHCLVSTFKYLLREQSARRHLECVARALKAGGIYVLGFHLSQYDTDSKTRERWVESRDGTHVTCNTQFWPPDPRSRLERVRTRLTVRENGSTRGFETCWKFRTYDARQVRRLLKTVPQLEHVATYDFTYRPDRPRRLDDRQLDVILILRRI